MRVLFLTLCLCQVLFFTSSEGKELDPFPGIEKPTMSQTNAAVVMCFCGVLTASELEMLQNGRGKLAVQPISLTGQCEAVEGESPRSSGGMLSDVTSARSQSVPPEAMSPLTALHFSNESSPGLRPTHTTTPTPKIELPTSLGNASSVKRPRPITAPPCLSDGTRSPVYVTKPSGNHWGYWAD